MNQPNVVPRLPELHKVNYQRWVPKGEMYVGTLEIFRENGSISTTETVVFEVPKAGCQSYLTVFKLVLYTGSKHGWALSLATGGGFINAKSAKIIRRGSKPG